MTHNAWERGTITLPSAAVAGLKKVLRDYTNTLHDEVRAEAVRLHKDVAKSTRSAVRYRERLLAHDQQRHAADRARSTGWGYTSSRSSERRALVTAMAREVLGRMLCAPYGQPDPTPHQPTLADVSKVIAKATNRTTAFPVVGSDGYAEGTISFDGRAVTWSVPESNHAVDRARESEVAALFFGALGRVAWTRGTGGTIWGNNEYNEGDHGSDSRGEDYLVSAYGPVGTDEQVWKYRRQGFSLKAARELVESLNRPAPRRAYGW